MEKRDLHSPDLAARNVEKIAALFPSVITEAADADGNIVRSVDFDLLRQELSDHIVEGPQERYRLDWPGKRAAAFAANAPIAKTLRPMREESVDFDTTKNLFIEGDNLDALKLLQESYLGKVKLIYIDPPYNTGRDFIYDDDYSSSSAEYLEKSGQSDVSGRSLVANTEANGRYHSDWLSMIYPRLKLARNLLSDDGAIFISIDDHEFDSLRRICGEIFGEENFVAQIIWQKIHTRKNSAQFFSANHDYIVVIARRLDRFKINPRARDELLDGGYRNQDDDPRGPWIDSPVQARNFYSKGIYAITCPSGRVIDGPPPGRYWSVSRSRFDELDADGRIWWGKDGGNVPRIKRFLTEMPGGLVPQTIWSHSEVGHTQEAKATLLKYVPFNHPENVLNSLKPVRLLKRILELATTPDSEDLVLDFFSGSGTTVHAVLEQNAEDGGNRRVIAVQIHEPLPRPEPRFDSILRMSLERIRNLGSELAKDARVPDIGFRLLRVASTNLAPVYHEPDGVDQLGLAGLETSIKLGRTGEDLLFQVLIDWGLELSLPIERHSLEKLEVLDVDKGSLIACFSEAVPIGVVRAIAARGPLRAVFRDSGFATDAARINAEQIFRELSPATEVRTI